mgnify:CR=1 FL=1
MSNTARYDVVVAGGGIAGVAAALAAAESGARTALIEKTVLFGGLATTGLIYAYLPICDGAGTQVSFGLAERLLHASIKYGPGGVPPDWNQKPWTRERGTYMTEFSPASYVLALDELLEEAGVDCWVDTLLCDVELDAGRRVRAALFENKSGRGRLEAACFVDATGDAELVRRAGGRFEAGGNFLAIWALQHKGGAAGKGFGGLLNMRYFQEGEAVRQGLSGRDVSRFVIEGRARLRRFYAEEYAAGRGNRDSLYPVMLPAMAQYRKIARIVGNATLTEDQDARRFEDSIGMVGDFRKRGVTYELPYAALVPEAVGGVLAAGRCVSADGGAWEVVRVIPTAAVTGEAAGVAAALAARRDAGPAETPVAAVQDALRRRGVKLHLPDVGLRYKPG